MDENEGLALLIGLQRSRFLLTSRWNPETALRGGRKLEVCEVVLLSEITFLYEYYTAPRSWRLRRWQTIWVTGGKYHDLPQVTMFSRDIQKYVVCHRYCSKASVSNAFLHACYRWHVGTCWGFVTSQQWMAYLYESRSRVLVTRIVSWCPLTRSTSRPQEWTKLGNASNGPWIW